ncbi:unnamed protein product [Gongylonema pulchrum]|uniref:WD_REPEATS_REGION domain-containing protein n=1 Tax=Gongylonema pulchrum TaxID=637853 RepID=A0A183DS08_9BILA|nr:unnamed protein product [Gongylonema pulchrum]
MEIVGGLSGFRQARTKTSIVRGALVHVAEMLCCRSSTGIVNLYDSADIVKNPYPKPVKVLDNLTTSIDSITFTGDSQLLAIASSVKRNAFRLVHVGSRSVYTNFPPRNANLGRVTVADFSPHSGYMAVGDDTSFLSLFRLLHFDSY